MNNNLELPPELGGGKEKSYIYEVHAAGTAENIEKILNDSTPYAYVYWDALPDYVILGIPNPKALAQRTKKPKIALGLELISEREARESIPNILTCKKGSKTHEDIDTFIILLHEKGYRIAKAVEKRRKN